MATCFWYPNSQVPTGPESRVPTGAYLDLPTGTYRSQPVADQTSGCSLQARQGFRNDTARDNEPVIQGANVPTATSRNVPSANLSQVPTSSSLLLCTRPRLCFGRWAWPALAFDSRVKTCELLSLPLLALRSPGGRPPALNLDRS